ncbi:hypothetical protein VSS37_05865 [Candidatus Thiothrix sp. Deng01]|uniref:Uncharacterized protein n=1 Tax=Candidatus Thiothrix phosphatis TaxID=3112415 RepID=A0ABU6CVS7_9GAMM|nr:hypothetical protein [Candidatus Thiothrix sp. Deng01]MEB4590498.1 hypothetical protein [Candidatus Thiothrix sp. Deng01]
MANELHCTVRELAGKVTVAEVEEWFVFANLEMWDKKLKEKAMTDDQRSAAITAQFVAISNG